MRVCKTCGALGGLHKPSCTLPYLTELGAAPTEESRTWRVQMVSGRIWAGSATGPDNALSKAQSANPGETPAIIIYPEVAAPAQAPSDAVDHPPHYGGADDPYEAIKVIEAWGLGFHLGNSVKYIARAGKKSGQSLLQDLKKARWYIDRLIEKLEAAE